MNRRVRTHLEEQDTNGARWLTTFNDLITLLMVFFVLTFSMGTVDRKKMKEFSYNLQSGIGVLEAGNKVGISIKPEIKQKKAVQPTSTHNKILNKIDDSITSIASEDGVNTNKTDEGVIIRLNSSILFDSGVAKINGRAFAVLNKISEIIKRLSCPVRIEGHTDNVPISTEQFPSNWDLSVARAVNVLKYLVRSGGIQPCRLCAAGYGDSRPIFPNDTPDNRAKNRRVEIILITKGGKTGCQKR